MADHRPKCAKCGKDFANESSLKTHYTGQHGGYDLSDLKASGVTPTKRDIARQLAGNASSSEVSKQAPESEPAIGQEVGTKRKRRSSGQEDPDVLAAKERILRARCQRAASLPYTLLGNILGEPDIKLD